MRVEADLQVGQAGLKAGLYVERNRS